MEHLDGSAHPVWSLVTGGVSSLAERETLYAYFQQLPVAVAIFRGERQVFEFINDAYAELIGRQPSAVRGQPLLEVFPELRGTPIEAIHHEVWASGQPREVQEHPVSFRRNGVTYEGFFNTKFQPLRTADGGTEGVIAVGYEVTELVNSKQGLVTKNHQFSQLADAMPQVVWMAGPNGDVTYYNRRVVEFAGATQTPDGTWHWEGVVHPDDLPATVEAWQRAVAAGRVYQHEHRIQMRDGTYRWHLSRGVPQYDATGGIVGWAGTATNIDDQKQAEEFLAYQKKLLETVTGNTSLALFLMDDHQHCIYMNEAAGEMTGFKLHELQGKQLHYFVHHTHPDGRPYPLEECPIDRALPQKRRQQGEEVFVHKDGHFYPVAFTASPIVVEGKPIGTVIEVRDTTEEKAQQQALRESEERFRTLAETLPHLVWMTNGRGEYEFASHQWQAYSGLDPTHPDTWASLVHPDDLPALTQAWEQCLHTGQPYKAEVRLRRLDGAFRWHAVHGEPLRDDAGNIARWIGAFTDVHDQKTFAGQLEALVAQRTQALYEANRFLEERNAQLQRANQELESFNYAASHDLQEPLRKIQSFIGFLNRKDLDEARRADFLDRVRSSAGRMSELLHDLLNYSRLSSPEARFVRTDLTAVLDGVKGDFEHVLAEKGAEIESEPLPSIEAVPLQMSQLFANLLGNALKFSLQNPRVTITAAALTGEHLPPELHAPAERRFVALAFRDNGIGFEPRYTARMFMLFQRLHPRSAYGGTGIGLTICKKIVDNHHGFITAEGQPGKGATFTVYLPVEQPKKKGQSAEENG